MYSGNREYYALKRRLIDEAKEKLSTLPIIVSGSSANSINNNVVVSPPTNKRSKLGASCGGGGGGGGSSNIATTNEVVFVYEWFDHETNILGYGCNVNGDACCIRASITPGLFVVSSNIRVLREVCALYGCTIQVYDVTYKTNNFAIWDVFANYDMVRPCNLVKIITDSHDTTMRIYSKFKYNTNTYKYVGVPQYYDVTKQILFELLIKRLCETKAQHNTTANADDGNSNKPIQPSDVPQTIMHWFDSQLNVHDQWHAKPNVPIITFDIETVSDDPHRVPTGDASQDILYSVSIHHTHTNILYSLIYLPLQKKSRSELTQMVESDGYDVVPDKKVDSSNCENILECYSSEFELLKRTMDLLTLGKKLHILLGYNSVSYDIKYLLLRCVFYNIFVERFVWREGYCFGAEQMHLDLFRIIIMRYRFKSYTLNDVSREIMKDSKTGVSAVALRYTFFKMLKTQQFIEHSASNERLPSIRDTLHYNNADTLLVSKLESRTKSIDFIISRAIACQVPLTTMTTNYNKMLYKLWNECFVVGLNLNIFLTTFKSHIANIKCPLASNFAPNDHIDLCIDLSEKLNANDRSYNGNNIAIQQPGGEPSSAILLNATAATEKLQHTRYLTTADKKAKFPGGANFCLGEYNVDNVQIYDYVTAYPLLMDRKNISDETVTILPASILLMLYPSICNHHEFKTYDYLAHSGTTKTETIILYYQYIYDDLYCGGEFPFTAIELHRRQNSPVIIIWEGRRGVLSEIVAKFNMTRARTKIMRKILDDAYALVEEHINTLVEQKQMMEEYKTMTTTVVVTQQTETVCELDEVFGFDSDDDDGDGDDGNAVVDLTANCHSNDDGNTTTVDDEDCAFGYDDDGGGSGDDDDAPSANAINSNDNDTTNNDDDASSDFGFDDFGSDDDNATTTTSGNTLGLKAASTTATTTTTPTIVNPFNFEFVNEFITVYDNQMCAIDEEALGRCDDPISVLSKILEDIALERSKIGNSYDLQKSTVSSIYGCVGKMIPVVAASITGMTRNALLASAQFCRKSGYDVLYIDTDSIMITGCSNDLSSELNRRFPHMEMEMKVARKCLFVKRKTYYKFDNGILKYGQNVNGPQAWRNFVNYFSNQTRISNNSDIYNSFYSFFVGCYKELLSFKSVTPDYLALFTQTIKTKNEYRTLTVAAKFKEYLAIKYPAIAGANKHKIFYYLDNTVMMPCLRPELDIVTLDDLKNVNLFKYYQNMFTTVFNLIKFHIRKNNEPYNLTISSKYVLLMMLKGFLDAYDHIFPNITPAHNTITIDDQTNADDVFCDERYDQLIDADGNEVSLSSIEDGV